MLWFWTGLERNHPESYHSFMWENFFKHIDIKPENAHILDGNAPDLVKECKDYEAKITAAGGIHLFIGGVYLFLQDFVAVVFLQDFRGGGEYTVTNSFLLAAAHVAFFKFLNKWLRKLKNICVYVIALHLAGLSQQ